MPELKVTLSGPFLTGQPAAVVDNTMRRTIAELVAMGEIDVSEQLYRGHGLVTGHYRRSIHGEVLTSRNGKVHDSKVVYGPWLEGTSSRNQRSRFKGYAMFRIGRDRTDTQARQIAERIVHNLMQRLN